MKNIVNKIIVVVILTIAVTSCDKSSKNYTINGTIDESLKVDSIFIYQEKFRSDGKKLGKAVVKDGKFTITGSIDTIQKVAIGNYGKDIASNFILENDKFNVKIDTKTMEIRGGEINELVYGHYNTPEYLNLMKEYNTYGQKLDAVDMESEEAPDEMAILNKKIDDIMNEAFKIEDSSFKNIVNNEKLPAVAKLIALTTSQDIGYFTVEKRTELLNQYEKEVGSKHPNLVAYRKFMEDQANSAKMGKTVTVGNPFKPVSGIDINGKELSLGSYVLKNKYTLLEFWASWCSPCRAEIPHLKEAYEKYKSKGLEIYSFSIDDNENEWRQALKEDTPTWVQTLAQGKQGQNIISSYGVQGIPASFLIDQNGIIVASNEELRGIVLDETLKKILK